MALQWTSIEWVENLGCHLWSNGDFDVINVTNIDEDQAGYGYWTKTGTGTGYETGDTAYGMCDGDASTLLTSSYGGDSVINVRVHIYGRTTSTAGDTDLEIQLGKDSSNGLGTMNSFAISNTTNAANTYTASVSEWGLTGADIESLIEAVSRGNSRRSFAFRPVWQNSTTSRSVALYNIGVSFYEDTLYEPSTGTGIVLGGSF